MFKKSISLVLILAMILSLTSGVFRVTAAENVKVTKTLFIEDFQSYDPGILMEATSTHTSPTKFGNISFQPVAGDKLEIVQEENGNKYLKITRALEDATKSHLKYYFPETYKDNKYAISYDFIPESHNKYFFRFGSFIRDNSGSESINLTTISYGNDFYANGSTSSNYYIPNLFKSENYVNSYATVTQTIDLTASSGNYEYHAVYPDSSGGIADKTVTNTANQLGIKGLAWGIQKNSNANYNGLSTGSTSVYRIDNITVSIECIDVIDSSVENEGEIYADEAVDLTFNEAVADNFADYVSVYKNGTLLSDGYSLSLSDDKTVLSVSGFSAGAEYSVKIDENLKSQDGTKAMKEAYELNFATVSSGDADEEEQSPTLLHFEDFEDYKAGVIYEATEYIEGYNNGFYYALYAGDKIEIAKDETGNKYLKFTRGSTGKNSSYVMYAFPEVYSEGVVSVAYDYKPEGHSQCFSRFGTIASSANGVGKNWPADKPVIQQIISYAKNVYVHSGTNASYYVGGINNIANYSSNECATVKQTIDFTSDANNYTFNAIYKNSGTNIGTIKRTVNTADINSIAWAVYKNTEEAWNGPDESSVYRIDNITVRKEIFEVTGSSIAKNEKIYSNEAINVAFSEAVADNFADYVSVYKNGALLSDGYTLSLSGDKTVLSVSDLEEGFDYEVKIDKSIKSASEKIMAEDYFLNFSIIGYLDLSKEDSKTSSLLHYEDFEDYEVGVIYDATEAVVKRIGNFYLGFFPGDKLEIAQEENGNKYLKLTRNSTLTDNSYVTYLFPQMYKNGKVSVSYDFRPDNNAHYFCRFGTLTSLKHGIGTAWPSNKPVVQQVISYGANHYVHSGTTADYYVGGLGNKANYAEGGYATITQKIDLASTSKNYTFSATYPAAAGGYTSPSSITRDVSETDINGISWSLRKHATASYNGPDSGASVYRIDNIVIENMENLSDGKKVIKEDFEGYEEKQYIQDISFISTTNKAGHKFEVATDPVTNSKALKATIGESSDAATLKFNFGKAEGKIVKLSFDMRFANHSRLLRPFLTLNDSSMFATYRQSLYWKSTLNPEHFFGNFENETVQHFEITVDPTVSENNVTAVLSNAEDVIKKESFTVNANADFEWSKINFYQGTGDYADHNGQTTGDGVYWIDNIRAEEVEYESTVAPAITGSTIENGAKDVSYKTNSVVLSLNDVLVLEETVTKENIRLYENDALVSSYSVALTDDNSVKVDFNSLIEDASYRLEVDGLTAKGKNPLKMESTYVLNFKTVGDIYINNNSLNLTENDKVFDFTAKIYNNSESETPYQAFLVVRGNNGMFKKLYPAEADAVASQDSKDISISGVEVDLTQDSCELFVWKSLAGLEPILDKVTLNTIKTGKTIVFAHGANSVMVDGELVSEELSIYRDGETFAIPAALASKYLFETASDLTTEDISNSGWGVYVSDEYGFIAVGDDVDFDDAKALETINKFGIFVSVDGDDANAGYASSPVQTLKRAVEIYESGNNQPVIVHAGEYRLTETLNLSSKSSGLTIKDFGDGEVKVSGAVELLAEDFEAANSDKIPASAKAYVKQIDLSSYVSGDMAAYPEFKAQHASTAYYELFAGDVAQTIARWPNEGFATIDYGILGDLLEKEDEFPAPSGKGTLWKNAENGMIAGYFAYDWAFENIYIDKANSSDSDIKLSKVPTYKIKNGQRYYAMNMLEELDAAGEYYIDNASKILYYYPTDDFGSINPELSVMTDALVSMTNASNVKISGITFENTRGKGIVTSGGSISLDNCVLRNIGNNAVSLSSSNSEVVNSHIYSIGGPAVTVTAGNNDKLTSGNVRVANNEIHNFGRIFRSYQGAIHLNGCGNIAQYNTIYDAPHNAIRFSGSNHQILNNEIYNVVNETCDAGAIYAGRNWTSWGNEIKNNYLHDIKDNVGSDSKVVAVYIDDMLSGTTVENNVMVNCECAALFGGGRGNKFVDNTVVNCAVGLQYDTRGEGSSHMTVDSDDTSDTVLEAFIKYIAKDSVVNSMEERCKNYHGFETLVEDVNKFVADNSYAEIGYPKDAIIKGNCFYGSNVSIEVENRVKNYGEYSEGTKSTTVPSYNLPDCGTRN